MSHSNLELLPLTRSAKLYNKYPLTWFKYCHLIEEVTKTLSHSDLESTSEIYMILFYISHCEYNLKILQEEKEEQVYEDCGSQELDNIEHNLKILIKQLHIIKKTYKCDLIEEITSLMGPEKKSNGTTAGTSTPHYHVKIPSSVYVESNQHSIMTSVQPSCE